MKRGGAWAVVLLLGCVPAARGEVVPIVSARSTIDGLTAAQIADVFLGRLVHLPGGTQVIPIDQQEGSAARDEFYLRIVGKSPAQLKAFWSKLIFTGRGRPPKALADSEAVLARVRGDPAAIGYVERDRVDATVRILLSPPAVAGTRPAS